MIRCTPAMAAATFATSAAAVVLAMGALDTTHPSVATSPASIQPGVREAHEAYFPPRDAWETRQPSRVGMDDALVAAAVEWAKTQETDMPRDFSSQAETFGRPLGPVPTDRAATNGIILRRGYIVAEWGDTAAVDPSYSIAKSYLSTILGVTIDRGPIKDVNEPVATLVRDGGYDSPHNAKVTWQYHVTQTSEWEGELFGKPHTFIGREEFGRGERGPRELREPGTFYEYNDVRINRFALSMLRVWERPLPDVLKTEIMDPIGASNTWVYHGYDNSTVEVEVGPDSSPVKVGPDSGPVKVGPDSGPVKVGPVSRPVMMVSVSGGTRWGGGLWMSTRDHARFGLLILNRGEWTGKRIVSPEWITAATSQQGVQKGYGYLWWLNAKGRWPDVPLTSFAALGAGNNSIWIDPEHEIVVVWRWHRSGDAAGEFYKRIVAAVK